jgi:hypothetical protein
MIIWRIGGGARGGEGTGDAGAVEHVDEAAGVEYAVEGAIGVEVVEAVLPADAGGSDTDGLRGDKSPAASPAERWAEEAAGEAGTVEADPTER